MALPRWHSLGNEILGIRTKYGMGPSRFGSQLGDAARLLISESAIPTSKDRASARQKLVDFRKTIRNIAKDLNAAIDKLDSE